VNAEVAKLGTASRRYAHLRRARRLKSLSDRWQRLCQVIEERAKDKHIHKGPGGKTGLVQRFLKTLRDGEPAGLLLAPRFHQGHDGSLYVGWQSRPRSNDISQVGDLTSRRCGLLRPGALDCCTGICSAPGALFP
jgi:hypothetical protein